MCIDFNLMLLLDLTFDVFINYMFIIYVFILCRFYLKFIEFFIYNYLFMII